MSSDEAIVASTRAAILRGQALFNAGEHWHAHEAWEDAWQEENGNTRIALQGLIQITAGYFKALKHRMPGGAVKLLTRGLEKLDTVGNDWAGLDLAPLKAAVRRTVEEARQWEQGTRDGIDLAGVPMLNSIDG